MVILKKIEGSTLVETLVASVIIVVVFMIASMSLNNIFKGTLKSGDTMLENRLKELSYLIKNEKVTLPFYEDTRDWEISIQKNSGIIEMEVSNIKTGEEKIVVGYEN